MSQNRFAMHDPLTWIINLPALPRRALALSLLLGAGLVVLLVVGMTAASTWQGYVSLQEKRQTAGRLQAIAALKPSLLRADPPSPISDKRDFFPGETEALIRSAMQSRVNEITGRHGATVLSVSNAPAREIDGASYIGIRADLAGTIDVVHSALVEIETTRPYFLVREATIWTTGDTRSIDMIEAPEILAQLRIYVPLAPDLRKQVGGPDQ